MERLYIQMDGEERERSCWADGRDTGIVGYRWKKLYLSIVRERKRW